MLKRIKLKISMAFLITSLLFCPVSFADEASTKTASDFTNVAVSSSVDESGYNAYIQNNGGITRADNSEILLLGADSIHSVPEGESFTADFTVSAGGWYALKFDYRSEDSASSDHLATLLLDGKSLFFAAEQIELPRYWLSGKITKSARGDDVRPEAKQNFDWIPYIFTDSHGIISDPFELYLSPGVHSLTLTNIEGAFSVRGIVLYTYKPPPSYKEYNKALPEKTAAVPAGDAIILEAEHYTSASALSVVASNDVSSPLTTPSDIDRIRLNTLGGANWKYTGERVQWTVTVPESGRYSLKLRYKQSYNQGLSSFRKLLINGEIPFKEAAALSFEYNENWQALTPGFSVYLEAGKNTLALETTLGHSAGLLSGTDDAVRRLNTLYRKIVMITGTSPDSYRDYALDEEIPELQKELISLSKQTGALTDEVTRLSGSSGQGYVLRDASRQLADMAEDIRSITSGGRLSRFKSNISSLASFAMRLREHPLLLDSITLFSPDDPPETSKEGFFLSLGYRLKRFFHSFVADYQGYGSDDYKEDSITVWISTGRDQMQILRDLIDNDFTPKSGISVRLQLVAGSLIQAVLAGKGPDVALNRGETDIINFAMRSALSDLTEFPEFNEALTRFSANASLPFTYENGIYALPETQVFDMMFVRTDILAELGLQAPETWNDLLSKSFTVLQRNNLTAGFGNLNNNGALNNIFTTLLSQLGGSLYTKNQAAANLNTPEALEAFELAVSFYRDYGAPTEYDFMNRFRTGEMPVAIAPYASYNLLQVGAPEIRGLWEMLPIPGTLKADGKIDRSQFMVSTACILLKDSKHQNEGWEFINWWTSAEAQRRFGLQQEAVLGASGRYTTANLEAMSALAWSRGQLKILESQRSQSNSMHQIPGGYYTGKALNNAMVTAGTISGIIAKEELILWDELIDLEIARKREEFGTKGGGAS